MGKTHKPTWLALGVAGLMAALLVGWLAVADLARADVSSLGVASATVEPGGTVTVNIVAEATDPGIGAYTVDIVYDGSLVSATDCTSAAGVCSIDEVGVNTVRLTGANAAGLTGTVTLGSITFQAGTNEGEAALTVSIETLADPEGTDISVTPTDGTITIQAPATPTPEPTPEEEATPTPTPTPTPAQIPETGGPPAGSSSGLAGWLLAVIGLGVAAAAAASGWTVTRMVRRSR